MRFLEILKARANGDPKAGGSSVAAHSAGYLKKLVQPVSCRVTEKDFATSSGPSAGTRLITSQDIEKLKAKINCAKIKVHDRPGKEYDTKTCKKFVAHVRGNMLKQLSRQAMAHAFPSSVDKLTGPDFLRLLRLEAQSVEEGSFTTDVCTRPGMGVASLLALAA